jgi:hypothetical protein
MLAVRTILVVLLALSCAVVPARAFADRVISDADYAYRAALDRYVTPLSYLVRSNSPFSRQAQSTDREAIVDLQFASDGKFRNLAIVERSGDSAYDMSLEFTLRNLIPRLPPPPAPPGTERPFTVTIRFCSYC